MGHLVLSRRSRRSAGENPECLKCHSADYRIVRRPARLETADRRFTAKYGVTCVGCHTPHDAGTAKGIWDEAFDAQLIGEPEEPQRRLHHLPQRRDCRMAPRRRRAPRSIIR